MEKEPLVLAQSLHYDHSVAAEDIREKGYLDNPNTPPEFREICEGLLQATEDIEDAIDNMLPHCKLDDQSWHLAERKQILGNLLNKLTADGVICKVEIPNPNLN